MNKITISQLDHVALHVISISDSTTFYGEVLGLQQMDRPDFDFPGAWFRLGHSQELHLVGLRNHDVQSHHRGTHFAIRVTDIDAVEARLESHSVKFIRKHRPDGAHQIFITDPDGHWVEFCCGP